MYISKIITTILFVLYLTHTSVITAMCSENQSDIYKRNILKIENKLHEIEQWVIENRVKGVDDKYPLYFYKRLENEDYAKLISGYYYECSEINGYWGRTIIKYEIVECGEVDSEYKYIKCRLWKRYYSIDEIFNNVREFEDYRLIDEFVLICDASFESVLNAYDDLITYKKAKEMKKKYRNCDVISIYYYDYTVPDKKKYIRKMARKEREQFYDFIDKIRHSEYKTSSYSDNRYYCRKTVILETSINGETNTVWLCDGGEDRVRKIFFHNENMVINYDYDNELFFKLNIAAYMYNDMDSLEYFFYVDNNFGLSNPDWLFRTLSKDVQKEICRYKMKAIVKRHIFNKQYFEAFNTNKNNLMKIVDNNFESYINKIHEYDNTPWTMRTHSCIAYRCPSYRDREYAFDLKTSKVTVKCPVHGKIFVPVEKAGKPVVSARH